MNGREFDTTQFSWVPLRHDFTTVHNNQPIHVFQKVNLVRHKDACGFFSCQDPFWSNTVGEQMNLHMIVYSTKGVIK